jgi:hypothetical protein
VKPELEKLIRRLQSEKPDLTKLVYVPLALYQEALKEIHEQGSIPMSSEGFDRIHTLLAGHWITPAPPLAHEK